MTQIEQIAQRITPSATPVVASKTRRSFEMFSITPVRDRIERGPNERFAEGRSYEPKTGVNTGVN
jgi:hypothetical protein